ncbi:MAG: J domain-containing protein [Planctomycetes bacterium]|nr:J domain-containing protein [Planctomycetota bacterium]
MISAYELLNVSHTATEEEILCAYRKAMFKYHPDHNSSPEAAAKAKQLNRAKDLLTDSVKRARYDQYLERLRRKTTNNSSDSPDTKSTNSEVKSKPKPATAGDHSTSVSSEVREQGNAKQENRWQPTHSGVRGKRPSKRRKSRPFLSLARKVAAILTGSLTLWILLVLLFDFDPLQIRTKLRTAFSENLGIGRDTADFRPTPTNLERSNPFDAKRKSMARHDENTNKFDEMETEDEVLNIHKESQGNDAVGSPPKHTQPQSISERESKLEDSQTDTIARNYADNKDPKDEESSVSQEGLLPLPGEEKTVGARDAARQIVRSITDGNQENSQKIAIEVFKVADANTSPEMKLAILESVLESAIENQQPSIAFDAVTMIENTFQTNAQHRSLDAVRKMISKSPPGFDKSIFTGPLIQIAQKSATRKDYLSAHEAFQLGVRLTPKAMRNQITQSFAPLNKIVLNGFSLIQKGQEAEKRLLDSPLDPKANLDAGVYLTFLRNDLNQGFKHLQNGSDPNLAKLATLELNAIRKPTEIEQLAEGWWEVSQKFPHVCRSWALARSVYWYSICQTRDPESDHALAKVRIKEAEREELLKLATVDLMAPNIKRDIMHGTFDEAARELRLDRTKWSYCHFMVPAPEVYDLEMKFTRTGGDWGMGIIFQVLRRRVEWCYSGHNKPAIHTAGFDPDRSPLARIGFTVSDGSVHTFKAVIRRNRVAIWLDGSIVHEIDSPFPTAPAGIRQMLCTEYPPVGFGIYDYWGNCSLHSAIITVYSP